ncbi:uncharacterized protein LOC116344593 [Contarinia nasturtii]|uniref:uncharacterized protein LOC116344593 n=1 Tax=Contarinia nasturtii TaxID=265458 RepID=UPI0012D3FE5D|nr:uncharacterized protein LOC116344593 [Contarinia nasturtii]
MESEVAKMLSEIIESHPKNDANREERNKEMSKPERLMHLFLKIVKYLTILGIVSMFSTALNYYGEAIGKGSKNKDKDNERVPYTNFQSRPYDPYFHSYDIYYPQPYRPPYVPATPPRFADNPAGNAFGAPVSSVDTVNRFDLTPDTSDEKPPAPVFQCKKCDIPEYKVYDLPANVKHALKFIRIG